MDVLSSILVIWACEGTPFKKFSYKFSYKFSDDFGTDYLKKLYIADKKYM